MNFLPPHLTSAALLIAGGLLWATTSSKLPQDTSSPFTPSVNLFGVCRSPYGEVFAMAMQTPIDTFWHARSTHEHHGEEDEDHENCEHDHEHHNHEECEHDHEDTAHGDREHDQPPPAELASNSSLSDRFRVFLEEIDKGVHRRTNHSPATPAFDFYLRRQIEDQLSFAYKLDPAHYGNYNTYHFFLTQPSLGTRRQLTPEAIQLAEQTIAYSLTDTNDPRPSLTAAGATCNILELLFEDQRRAEPQFNLSHIKSNIELLDACLARNKEISSRWDESDQWRFLSPMRIQEYKGRLQFILKIRFAANEGFLRLANEHKEPFSTPSLSIPSTTGLRPSSQN